ncbi:MAG: hypothetical protein D6755_05900 [Anaerolineae bacterium]|nr:MAG: hypothetical protein D6755_05900 [Anaerolineae bacterium]
MPQMQRLLSAGALAALLGAWMRHNPAYPPYWDIALTLSVALSGLWSPLAAFWLAGLGSLYGVYHISFYLAVLWLCVLILAQRAASRHLGATALLLAAPFLARWRLLWVAPLFGGLYLGTAGGAWMGVFAAAWSETLAALHGFAPDFLQLAGHPWSISVLQARFAGLNSWRTLGALATPLAPNPTALLYHLLQIALWGLAGALVGRWMQENPRGGHPSGVLLTTLKGALLLEIAQGGLSLWLGQHPAGWFASQGLPLLLNMLFAPLALTWLEVLRDFFQRPLPLPPPTTRPAPENPAPQRIVLPDSLPQSENLEKNDDESDLIMLELD